MWLLTGKVSFLVLLDTQNMTFLRTSDETHRYTHVHNGWWQRETPTSQCPITKFYYDVIQPCYIGTEMNIGVIIIRVGIPIIWDHTEHFHGLLVSDCPSSLNYYSSNIQKHFPLQSYSRTSLFCNVRQQSKIPPQN